MSAPPEHNVTGVDYGDRRHFRYAGPPLLDVHAHVTRTKPDAKDAPPSEPTLDQAATMLAVAEEFGVAGLWSMCPPEDIAPLRERFGRRLRFNGPISKKLDEPEDVAYRLLDRFLAAGVDLLKFWAAPRGRD